MSRWRAGRAVSIAAVILLAAGGLAFAAQSPFGVSTPDTSGTAFGGPLGPVFHWIALRQTEFYQGLTAALSATKADGTATWLLLGLSFLYGIFHAAGPGHGKAVISSYLVASGETARRGVVISFAAAVVQAISAIVVVTIFRAVFNVTAVTMTVATNWLEIASYGLIMLLGAWLVWTTAFGHHHHHHHHHLVPAAAGHGHANDHVHTDTIHDDHDHHGHDHHGHDHHGHHHQHDHGRSHGHGGASVSGAVPGNPLMKAWSTILAVGIRPCSGAIIVLVFAWSQDLFAVGIAATFAMALGTGLTVAVLAAVAVSAKGLALRLAGAESGFAGTVLRGIEIAGGVVVFLFGFLLLGGALSAGVV